MPGSGVAGVVVSPEPLCDEGGQKTTNRGEKRIWLELHDLHGVLLCPWIRMPIGKRNLSKSMEIGQNVAGIFSAHAATAVQGQVASQPKCIGLCRMA